MHREKKEDIFFCWTMFEIVSSACHT